MLKAAEGSQEAFAVIVVRHQKPLVNFFHRMGAISDCEDLAQETFVRLFRYRDRYKPVAKFTSFLYHIARNVWADRGRKALRRERLDTELRCNAAIAQNLHEPEQAGAALDVEAALGKLSPKLREVIVLNIYQGLRYQDVADVLEIPLGTVKSRINLAMAALREEIDEQ